MGIGSWLARKGNIGGTARSVALAYNVFYQMNYSQNRNFEITSANKAELFNFIVDRRKLLSQESKNRLKEDTESFLMSISGLVELLIAVQVPSFYSNDAETLDMWRSIIDEELIKNGVPASVLEL